jgi:hypothetical protein
MNNVKAIINGNLQPWQQKTNLSDDYYSPELRKMHPVQENFSTQYRIDFGIVPFSVKIKYYLRLIDIDIVEYMNGVLNETIGGSENLIAYKLNKTQKKIQSLLVEVNELIERKQFDIAVITSRHADFKIDRNHKECTFIFHYMLVAVMRSWLEIQAHFIQFIHNEDVLSIADIYSQILQKAVPEKPQIQEIHTIEVKPDIASITRPVEKEEAFVIQYAQEKYSVFMETVNPYRFIELPKLKALNETAKNSLLTALIENPLHYSIAMLSFLGYMESLKISYSLTKEKSYSHIAKALKSDVRTIKGNCLVLNPNSNEDRYKYQADQYIVIVEQDYNKLLAGKPIK